MKLTLTIEGDVIHRAKEYARVHNQSLSGMVESYLLALTAPVDREPHKHAPPGGQVERSYSATGKFR